MKTEHTYLCIGGPKAGQQIAVLPPNTPRMIVLINKTKFSYDFDPAIVSEKVEVEYFEYRATTLHTPQSDLTFWVPMGQTDLETMRLLMEAYIRSPTKEEQNG